MRKYRKAWAAKNRGKTAAAGRRFRVNHMATALILAAKYRAMGKGIPFDLDQHREELTKRVNAFTCELTGIPLDPTARKAFNSASLDRIEPALGYVYSNIRVVSYAVNCALGTWGENVLRMIATRLLERK